ncbi:MAG: hypothetical protein FJW39_31735 [Acidobacteria bacterium]|nr:hypothetical protein [Acidobacteriota bacterium]
MRLKSAYAGMTIIVAVVASLALVAQSRRDWQQGICRDVTTDSKVVSLYSSATASGNTVTGSTVPISIVHAYYVVEADDMIYIGAQRLRWRWSKPIDFTINRPIRFAVEKRDLYLLDEQGKEHKIELIKRIAKEQ